MPKKSTKSKSKRTTLKQKYKVIRKVREHHKKKRKEENRLKRLGIKPKGPRESNPGAPSAWPYKDELMREIDHEREKMERKTEEMREAKRARRAENKRIAREMVEAGEPAPTLERLRAATERRETQYEEKKAAKLAEELEREDYDQDASCRAYYKEFVKVVELSDVIIQVLDARDPLSCCLLYTSPSPRD